MKFKGEDTFADNTQARARGRGGVPGAGVCGVRPTVARLVGSTIARTWRSNAATPGARVPALSGLWCQRLDPGLVRWPAKPRNA